MSRQEEYSIQLPMQNLGGYTDGIRLVLLEEEDWSGRVIEYWRVIDPGMCDDLGGLPAFDKCWDLSKLATLATFSFLRTKRGDNGKPINVIYRFAVVDVK